MINTRKIANIADITPWLLALALVAGGSAAQAAGRPDGPGGVAGRVLGETSPLGAAGVYAYQLADLSLRKVSTDGEGNFLFQELPAGLYKIIAHKAGFNPVVVMLTRTAATAYQFVELQLAPQPKGPRERSGDDFWALRARIPADVLRDIDAAESQSIQLASLSPLVQDLPLAHFQTEMEAMTGVDQMADAGDGQLSTGGVGIAGQVGQVQVGLRGQFRQFNPDVFTAGSTAAGGEASALSLDLKGDASCVSLTSLSNRLVTNEGGPDNPVAFEHYQVNWTQGVGQNGRSDFAAQYTEENNFHRQGPIDPLDIPAASRTWRVEGAYTTSFGEGSTLQAGLRYRERQFDLSPANRRQDLPGQASVDLFGQGGVPVRPAVLVEYGLYSTLADGSLSLSPKGGIVFQLDRNWQLEGNASRRVYQDAPIDPSFFPTFFEEGDLCEQGTDACYQLQLARKGDDDSLFSLRAADRQIGETLRLYFSDDFFDRLESLYLVPGDRLPEAKLTVSRRISPKVLTSFESSVAMGGGGTFLAADGRPYENKVRYVITSLDTRFQSTATGVFVALHHLSQELVPLASDRASSEVELDRVRLMLSQDLNILFDLAATWAVQLNMELSRGPESTDEIRRQFLGGIAVKF